MKRPLPIYFVAAWCFFAFELQIGTLSDRLKAHLPEGQMLVGLLQSIHLLVFIFVVWHIVRLIQLRALNRWLSIVFFLLWTAIMTGNSVVIFLSVYDRLHSPLRLLLVMLTFSALNIASACYLARRRFREFAVQFVAERESLRHSRMMQRISEKKLAHEVRK
jgi:hypothetical protein